MNYNQQQWKTISRIEINPTDTTLVTRVRVLEINDVAVYVAAGTILSEIARELQERREDNAWIDDFERIEHPDLPLTYDYVEFRDDGTAVVIAATFSVDQESKVLSLVHGTYRIDEPIKE